MLQAYRTSIDEGEKERIIKDLLPYIKYTAYRIAWRLPPQLTVDDLVSVGIIGLLDAIDRYDPSRQANLKTYAEYRIKGSMLDELRAAEWTPKHLQKKINTIKATYSSLEQKLGRPPSEEEVAEELDIDLDELFKLLNNANASISISLDEIESRVDRNGNGDYNIHDHIRDDKSDDPLTELEKADSRKHLKKAITRLPEREQMILSLYYWEELTFREIGQILQISESRVSQLHSQALIRIRGHVQER